MNLDVDIEVKNIKTDLHEFQYNDPVDDAIVIPKIKKMKFKLGKPKIKEFSI